jgi:hypothetical protein
MAPSAFDDEVRVGVGETVLAIPSSSITTSVEGPMHTRSAGSLRRTLISRARHPYPVLPAAELRHLSRYRRRRELARSHPTRVRHCRGAV